MQHMKFLPMLTRSLELLRMGQSVYQIPAQQQDHNSQYNHSDSPLIRLFLCVDLLLAPFLQQPYQAEGNQQGSHHQNIHHTNFCSSLHSHQRGCLFAIYRPMVVPGLQHVASLQCRGEQPCSFILSTQNQAALLPRFAFLSISQAAISGD